ncbi:MAG: TPR end-of-group domain-containing protein [Bacteroidales bacterium]
MDLSRKFLYLYQQADPYNGDMLYFWSVYYAKLNQYSRAIDSLSKAIKLGFTDKSLLQSESSFFPIRDSLRFNDILTRLK